MQSIRYHSNSMVQTREKALSRPASLPLKNPFLYIPLLIPLDDYFGASFEYQADIC